MSICACGCNQEVEKGSRRKYIDGHFLKPNPISTKIIIECACGCGQKFEKHDKHGRIRKFISGHNTKRQFADPTEFKRQWNYRNRKKRQEYKQKFHRKRKIELLRYKGNKCECCDLEYNGKNAAIFHFHHLRDKKFTIGNKLIDFKWKEILLEVDKCILLCANCHEMKHSGEF